MYLKYIKYLIYFKYKPGEKIEFSLLMHEINVLTNWTILAKDNCIKCSMFGWISWFEQKHIVPHTTVLPIKLYPLHLFEHSLLQIFIII